MPPAADGPGGGAFDHHRPVRVAGGRAGAARPDPHRPRPRRLRRGCPAANRGELPGRGRAESGVGPLAIPRAPGLYARAGGRRSMSFVRTGGAADDAVPPTQGP